ncbi:MAG: PAS domain S-box protein, partial [Candidatus Heimdallarchaeaceae archaeon]
EEKFRNLFNEMKQAYALYEAIYDEKGNIEDAIYKEINPEYEKLVSMKREGIIGKKISEILPNTKKQDNNPIALLGRTAITGETIVSEYFNKDLGKWLLSKSFSPMKDHAAILFEDITEKHVIEEELEKERKATKQYLDIANIILTVIDANENVILVNRKGCELLGYDQEELIGENWFDSFLPERIREKTKGVFQELLTGNITHFEHHENLILTKEGEERLIAWDNTYIRDEKGKIISILSSGKDITEMKKTQRELKDSEEKFRMIFNNANDALYLYSLDDELNPSNFIEINDIACKMLGYTEDEFKEMSPNDLTSKDTSNQFPEILSKLRTLEKLTFEGNHYTKGGKRIPVEISAHTFQYNDKQMVLTIVRDISERKISEEKLRQLNEELEEKVIQRTYQMETLYNIIKDISETFDLKEAMEIIAKYISQLVDYDIIVQLITQEEINLIQIEVPEGNKEVADEFLLTVKDKFVEINPDSSVNRDSINIITADERKIQEISSHISIPLIAEDKVVGFIVVGSEKEDAYCEEEIWFLYKIADNISHTLQRLKVILTAKDELETVLNHTSDGIILLNSHESVVMVNDTGSKLLESIKDSKTNKINNEVLDLKELKQIGKKELALNGDTYYISMSPIKTDFVHGWLLTAHDITEERAMQKKILHQDRLATLGKITGGIAHDFNNILASIIGAADFSLMNSDNLESKEFLNLIIRQSEKGASLIRQMLDFTRQTVIKPKPVSMLNFITEFSRVIRSSLPENIILSAVTEDWTVFMDQGQLQQLFMNLILNSRDALAHGGKINISVEEVNHSKIVDFEEIEIDKNQDYIHLIVDDNGEGMNEQTKNKIFEPFYTTKDPGKGSGLGLAQVYGIVRLSKGYINIESELGVGTKVHIYIPKYEKTVEAEVVERTNRGEGRILLVEDDEDVREITKMMLENHGYIVITAENGKKALSLYDDSFDLVLTDIIMPVMGGEKLIERLLKINPQVKCLAMTGYSDVNVPAGIKVLSKPMTTSKLVNYVQNELDHENYQEKAVQNEKRADDG